MKVLKIEKENMKLGGTILRHEISINDLQINNRKLEKLQRCTRDKLIISEKELILYKQSIQEKDDIINSLNNKIDDITKEKNEVNSKATPIIEESKVQKCDLNKKIEDRDLNIRIKIRL
jgi:hypothetical protein